MQKEIKKLDCFGDICPLPILKAIKMLEKIEKGESFMLITDHSCVVQSIQEKNFVSDAAIDIEEVMNGVWEIIITKK